jgi:uncharacterized protein (TIGR02145 family)
VSGTTGTYQATLAGLNSNTTYYVRAFATNTAGTSYGNQVSFTTLTPAIAPTLTTNAATNVTTNSATIGAEVVSQGNSPITTRGFAYSTSPSPTTSNQVLTVSGSIGTYQATLAGLNSNTTYYVRAFATNTAGTSYGNQVSFTTLTPSELPTVTTGVVTNITTTSAAVGGSVTSSGSSAVTVRGICYATTQNPTISNQCLNSGSGTGSFSINITGLNPNTTYYIRAYATSSAGTSYGTQVNFTTLIASIAPTVSTTNVTNVTITTATMGGNVTNQGSSAITSRGLVYSTLPNPTTSNQIFTVSGTTGTYQATLAGLNSNTTYYVRAFAANSAGMSYGNQVSFTTLTPSVLPTVTTGVVTNITSTSATLGGNVTSSGSSVVSTRGICYAITQNPTTSDICLASGSGTGSFTVNLPGLISSRTYYARAYATSSAGTSYGSQVIFNTLASSTCASVTDIDGNNYPAIQIGNQCWMASNLKTTRFNNGNNISQGTLSSWNSSTSPLWIYLNESSFNNTKFGKLYNWRVISDTRNVCPVGWQVPTPADFNLLINFTNSTYGSGIAASKALRLPNEWFYGVGNLNGSNLTGYSLYPSGGLLGQDNNPPYFYDTEYAVIWTNELGSSLNPLFFILTLKQTESNFGVFVFRDQSAISSQRNAHSVRCIKQQTNKIYNYILDDIKSIKKPSIK